MNVSPISIAALGFVLGLRHATDADHVVAVSTIVSRTKSLGRAALVGAAWGLGHSTTILAVGGAIVAFDVAVSARLGLGLELCVAAMLVVLGASTVWRHRKAQEHAKLGAAPEQAGVARLVRPLVVGVVHGLAGSAGVTLIVVPAIKSPVWAVAYLGVFGLGTIAGMMLVTTALSLPFRGVSERFERLHRSLALASGVASVGLGLAMVYRLGFVDGLFGV